MANEPTILNQVNGVPMWVKIIMYIGYPAFITLVFLGIFVGYIPSPITEVKASVTDLTKELEGHSTLDGDRIRILRSICRNTANTEIAKLECDR